MALSAGTATLDITPPLGAQLSGSFSRRFARKIHDPLYAKALVISNGETKMGIVICDIIILVREDLDKAKEQIQRATGIPPEMILIAATHTHSGPAPMGLLGTEREEQHMQFITKRIADAVSIACQEMVEIELGVGAGSEDSLVFNRRYWMTDGTVKMNPGPQNPDIIRAAGPIDPEVGVLCFRMPHHGLVALLCNYALHYVGTGEGNTVSAGYFEFFADAIQQMMGQKFWAAIGNGCCGDINNINVHEKREALPPYVQATRVARTLGAEVVKVVERMEFSAIDGPLAAKLQKVVIPRRRPTEEQLKDARELLAKDPDGTTRDHVYARARLFLLDGPTEDETYVHAMRIGDVGIVGLPGEMFVEIGLDIKQRSPFDRTLVIELANDWIGYIPARHSFDEGGYETWLGRTSRATPAAGQMMADTAVQLLEELKQIKA